MYSTACVFSCGFLDSSEHSFNAWNPCNYLGLLLRSFSILHALDLLVEKLFSGALIQHSINF